MKYIRTKERIFEYNPKEQVLRDGQHIFIADLADPNYLVIPEYTYYEKDIIKQADTIEELCDGFIFKDTNTNKLHFLDSNSGMSLLGASLFVETLRGFIETEKGLIYVVKMNEKGEWELL